MFDLTDITNFANDNFAIEWDDTIADLIENMQIKLETIIEWLKDNMDLCQFYRKDHHPVTLNINGQQITSKNEKKCFRNNFF